MIDLGLTAKRAIVAGAGHRPPRPGIGRQTALLLAQGGARVACVDLDEARAAATAAEVTAGGGEAIVVTGDLRRADEADRIVAEVVAAFGGLDICIDIIGEATWGITPDFAEDAWDWAVETNLKQVFLLFQSAARQMRTQGTGGALAAVASVDGIMGSPVHVAYGCAKAGVVHLVKTLSEELGPYGIRANAVAPGAVFVPTEEHPEPGPGVHAATPLRQPQALDIARGLVFFCSDMAWAVSGQTLAVDGGASVKGVWDFPPAQVEALLKL
jgi:NAD(P)-dependent dehydrogenase (short-subunit alcohol dehydrogenase family)